jgi:hypothetical protein
MRSLILLFLFSCFQVPNDVDGLVILPQRLFLSPSQVSSCAVESVSWPSCALPSRRKPQSPPSTSWVPVLYSRFIDNSEDSIDGNMEQDSTRNTATIQKMAVFQQSLSNVMYGANFVHSQYLHILWKYSIVQSLAFTMTFGIVLWGSRFYDPSVGLSVYNMIHSPLFLAWTFSSGVASILQLPLETMKRLISSTPALLISVMGHLPNFLAVPLVQTILGVRDSVAWLGMTANSNHIASFLSSVFAVLIWRPAVEEWEYRSILNKCLFAPGLLQSVFFSRGSSVVNHVKFIPLDNNNNLLTNTQPQSENGNDNNNQSITTTHKSWRNGKILLPVATESNRILLGSVLFATTRLGWLSWDPVSGDHSTSPYSWTIGFLQSIMAHFSSQVLPEVRPGLRIWILLLAIHQTVSTFLVAQYIFASVYRERGLAASIGAHVTWTISKGTIPFRLLGRLRYWLGRSTNKEQESDNATSIT